MRATYHSGRSGSNGNYNASHCDRNFNLESEYAEHINSALANQNLYYVYDAGSNKIRKKKQTESFEEIERNFYRQKFSASAEKTNQRYLKNRHPEKCRTTDDIYESQNTCPEETIITIGNSVEGAPSKEVIQQIILDQLRWESQNFPKAQILDFAYHVDEPDATPHFHIRRTYLAEKDGTLVCNQTEALRQMGVAFPNPDKPESRMNNAKVTHTKLCREHLVQLCRAHGLSIEEPKGKGGLSLTDYKKLTAEKAELLNQLDTILQELSETQKKLAENGKERIRQLISHSQASLREREVFSAFLEENGLKGKFEAFRAKFYRSKELELGKTLEELTEIPEIAQTFMKFF